MKNVFLIFCFLLLSLNLFGAIHPAHNGASDTYWFVNSNVTTSNLQIVYTHDEIEYIESWDTGSAVNSGDSFTSPMLTVEQAEALAGANDTIIIAGVFQNGYACTYTTTLTPTKDISILGANYPTLYNSGDNIIIAINGTNLNVLRYVNFESSGVVTEELLDLFDGWTVNYTENCSFKHHSNPIYAIEIRLGSATAVTGHFKNNFLFYDGKHSTTEILSVWRAQGYDILHNTIVCDTPMTGSLLYLNSDITNTTNIDDNIFIDRGGATGITDAGSAQGEYNCFYNLGTDESGITTTNKVSANPLLIENSDTTLFVALTSPCVNAGSDSNNIGVMQEAAEHKITYDTFSPDIRANILVNGNFSNDTAAKVVLSDTTFLDTGVSLIFQSSNYSITKCDATFRLLELPRDTDVVAYQTLIANTCSITAPANDTTVTTVGAGETITFTISNNVKIKNKWILRFYSDLGLTTQIDTMVVSGWDTVTQDSYLLKGTYYIVPQTYFNSTNP